MDYGVKSLRKFSFIRPKYIIVFGVVISLIMIVSSYIEFSENKHEIYHLLDEHANSIIFSLDKSSVNSVIADREMENILTGHLLGVAYNVARLDSISKLSHELLVKIAEENEIYRINVFNSNGIKDFSNYIPEGEHRNESGKYSPNDFIDSILNGKKQEIIIGLKSARMEKGVRYAVAVRRPFKKGAIVVNLDAESFLEFRKKIGFEKTVSDISKKSGIEYIVLQNEKGIIVTDLKTIILSDFKDDVFLQNAFNKDSVVSRINSVENRSVYEIVKPFVIDNEKIGLFRVGLSMEEIHQLENKMLWRGAVISLVLIIITLIVIAVVVSNQNYKMVSEEFNKIQTFTGDILANMTQAVITVNGNNEIEIFNKKAEDIFGIISTDVLGKKTEYLSTLSVELFKIIEEKKVVNNLEFIFNSGSSDEMILLLNSSVVKDINNNIIAFNMVIDDVTDSRNSEKQKHLNEKLIAMGELASGVAHEVRNPLNSINMIAQRLEKEYSTKLNSEEFNTLSNVLKTESSRVNNIVEQFLRFARPAKLNRVLVSSSAFINQLKSICGLIVEEKGCQLDFLYCEDMELYIDVEQMKQVFINLVQNAVDAVAMNGKISVSLAKKNSKLIFEIADNGSGIKQENLNKIFNLYFTTKSNGTGLGLSIVQQIISQHGGNIKVESGFGKGTKFTLELLNKKYEH
jgi:PAS domain S-box-containing protein